MIPIFSELWSLIIVNIISFVAWIIDIIAFCTTTKRNSFIISCIVQFLRILIYIYSGLHYSCMVNIASLFIFLYNAFLKFYNFMFSLIVSIILIIWYIIEIGNIYNINLDNMIPIIGFLLSTTGITFCESMHVLRIFKGIIALIYLYYNISHNIIFSAAQNLFVVLLMVADILINKFDKKIIEKA